ncbi:hypothetical protein Tco_0319703 [Tanacetum coccineum]
MGLWYPKDSGFELTAFSTLSLRADALILCKALPGGIQFLGENLALKKENMKCIDTGSKQRSTSTQLKAETGQYMLSESQVDCLQCENDIKDPVKQSTTLPQPYEIS